MPTEQESANTSSTIRQQLVNSLASSKEYRHAFIDEMIRTRLTAQIKALRDQQGWDYKQFAAELHKKPSWTYRLEDPNEPCPTVPTLLQVAEAFDVAVDVRFVPFSAIVDDTVSLGPESFRAASFKDDAELIEQIPPLTSHHLIDACSSR